MRTLPIPIPEDRIQAFCRTHHIRKLALFGSVLRDDFTPESDVDILVEFEPGTIVGLISLASMGNELSELIGRRADLNTVGGLSPYFRDEVLSEAETIYVAA